MHIIKQTDNFGGSLGEFSIKVYGMTVSLLTNNSNL